MLRQTLERRAKRRLCVGDLPEETRALIDDTIAELEKLGLLDDARFAEARARTLAGKGLSRRRIAQGPGGLHGPGPRAALPP